jgi:hypothetical protein
MKKNLLYLILVMLISACQEVINPNIENRAPALVVEGLLSTRPEENNVTVTSSLSFSDPFYKKPISNLTVYVVDNQGKRINFTEVEHVWYDPIKKSLTKDQTGVYITGKDTGSAAKIGNTYTLFIEGHQGHIYSSTPQKVIECPKITEISILPDNELILNKNQNNEFFETKSEGLSIYADVKGILPNKNYYLFRWFGYKELEHFNTTDHNLEFIYRRLANNYESIICTGNSDDFEDNYIQKKKLVYIPNSEYLGFSTELGPDENRSVLTFDGIILSTQLLSLSEDAYNYWKQAENLINASNKLFDPISTHAVGNMTCLENTEIPVYGIFNACDSKLIFNYLYIKNNRTYVKEIDSLPDFPEKTINEPPLGWIKIPF